MTSLVTRRQFSASLGFAAAALPFSGAASLFAEEFSSKQIAPFRTPYKYGKLVLSASPDPAAFDCKSVDDPFVFLHDGDNLFTSDASQYTGIR